MSTITVPKGCKPSKIASCDQTRPILTGGNIAPAKDGNGYVLHVTDSYKAIRLPVTVSDNSPAAVLKVADRGDTLITDADTVRTDGTTYQRPEGQYPDMDKIWPDPATLGETITIGLNATYLQQLAQALGSTNGHVALTVSVDNRSRPMFARKIDPQPSATERQSSVASCLTNQMKGSPCCLPRTRSTVCRFRRPA